MRFPGQVFDGQAGLHQNGYRDYDPAIGRYAQSDPTGLKGGLDTYAYVNGRPTQYIDPVGLIPCPGGVWNEDFGDASFSLSFGGYVSKGAVSYTCQSRPDVKCRGQVVCIGGGPILGGGIGWNVYGYATGAPDSGDLAGWSGWQATGGIGPVGFQAPWGGGLSVAPGVSAGAGLAFVRCNTYHLQCTSPGCHK